MIKFNFSANGMDFGNHSAASLDVAKDLFASDAGYASWGAMVEQADENGGNNVEIREVLANGQLGSVIE